ncbi:tyrosine-type recombinase/integrase [Carboxydothermus hydrogenoformans]|uniref:Site-specific recombinase, phage integrase family n=1 Tax=Carboxydothermus hydrogenoformans (strain ATCC BAA-161 / DSM 6008 / Z-2901) TaxID=246194 RepID=Q3A8S8_CARHZ|nr:tyrosine-type recombinase/integrase [Carboxydothermus hydrogenoformans]ABB14999.1 site-specific recombinase, phage integrase family [Carboxydothermus hydrogenoformans Z-2901]
MPKPIPFKKSLEVNLSQLKEEFLIARQADGLAPRTLEDYRWHIEKFMELTGANPTYEAVRKAILQHLSEPSSPRYRNIKLQYLKAFFNWCVREGYLPANPTDGIRKAKEDISNVRHVSIEAVKKLLAQPDKKTYAGLRDYCLMLVQIDTGARPSELLQIKPDDLNLDAREIYVRADVAKTRIGRTLVISPFTVQALMRFLKIRPSWWSNEVPLFASENGRQLTAQRWSRIVKRYCEEAGVKVTPYGLRHTFAIEFLKGGGDPFSLQRILGHTDLTMTRRYVRLSQDDIKEIHEKASPIQKLQYDARRAPRRI